MIYTSHTNDVITCILNALENNEIKGLEYALRGSTSTTFDGLLDMLSKHCNQPAYEKISRNRLTGFFEKLFIGQTHDKNFMDMIEWHEIEQQNYLNDWNYMKRFNIKETITLKETYAESKVNQENYVKPYLYKYKHIVLE